MKKRTIINGLLSMLITCTVVVLLNLWMKGIPCLGLPNVEDITRVEIIDRRYSQEPKVYSDGEKVDLARNVANFLNYKPGEVTDYEKVITIRYEMNDGEIVEISANETTVFWKEKVHVLKDDKTFMNLVEGIFFLEESVEAEVAGTPSTEMTLGTELGVSSAEVTLKTEEGMLSAEEILKTEESMSSAEAAFETEGDMSSAEMLQETDEVRFSNSNGQILKQLDVMSIETFPLSRYYLCKADLYAYTKEELRLLRNAVYAFHGAEFQSKDLREYFERMSWYQGTIPTAEFPERRLNDAERANVALIKKLESQEGLLIDGVDYQAEYEALEETEYLPWLDLYRETALYADMTEAEDLGIYYVVKGEIGIPLTITEKQVQELESGEELELVVNEITGETMMLSKIPGSMPGVQSYYFYEPGTKPDQYTMDASAYFSEELGAYILWWFSDDTIMKIVYEGDICILKGAVKGGHVSLELASMDQQLIRLPKPGEDSWSTGLGGNYVRHDGRGYITAVFNLSD